VSIRDARIRDRRRRSWFSTDNEIVDDYGPKLGIYGLGVYCVLCRYAYSETEEATVSLRTLARKLRVGQTKLLETLDALEDAGLISIERGDRAHSNVYTLLEVPKKGAPNQEQVGAPGREHPPAPGQERYKRSVSQNSSKGTKKNKEVNPYSLEDYLKSRGLDDYFGLRDR
jgi:DNA-binding MarR family transcriptional regulator